MPVIQEQEYLTHYGVPGMKWGVRKSRSSSSSGTRKRKKTNPIKKLQQKARAKAKSASAKKPLSDVSDEELRKRINRLQMEKQYRELTAPKVSAGRKFVNDVLSTSSRQIASKYVTQYSTKLIDSMIESAVKKKK